MSDRIRLIWDFKGPESKHMADHHAQHLSEFVEARKLEETSCGVEVLSPMRTLAFMEGEEIQMEEVKPILRPHYEKEVE